MVATRTAVLDTNVLLLFLVARVDLALLRWKRVSQFSTQDASVLAGLLGTFREIATTPHVLAETDNFVDQAPIYRRQDMKGALAQFIELSPERYRPAGELATQKEFFSLGLTDCGLIDFQAEAVVITTDFELAGRVSALGGIAINFRDYLATYN
jgi:hypothetical protein